MTSTSASADNGTLADLIGKISTHQRTASGSISASAGKPGAGAGAGAISGSGLVIGAGADSKADGKFLQVPAIYSAQAAPAHEEVSLDFLRDAFDAGGAEQKEFIKEMIDPGCTRDFSDQEVEEGVNVMEGICRKLQHLEEKLLTDIDVSARLLLARPAFYSYW